MNFREWILPLSLAVVTTVLFQYFINPDLQKKSAQNSVQSGQSFTAPTIEDVSKPLQLDVDFKKNTDADAVELKKISTDLATYTFSNKGAVLKDFQFSWQNGHEIINTLDSYEECFLLALDKETPLMYKMTHVSNETNEDASIQYEAAFQGGKVVKTFTMYQDSYKVNLSVDVQYNSSKVNEPVTLRLFLAQPFMNPTIGWDTMGGVVNSAGSSAISEINLQKDKSLGQYWVAPTSFGYTTKFLVHALTQDDQKKLQRAYFRKDAVGMTTAILESKQIINSGKFDFSFFVGPKTISALDKVDPRLTSTLNYGWFSALSKPMLHLMNYLNEKTGSYGWAIILLTMLIKLLLLPFTISGEKNMRKGVDMQKKLAYLQQKYKHDKDALDRERAELIRKHGMPGLTGCLPALLNIPFFIALNKVLSNSIELYGADFLWISNLAEKDPYYILPIATGLAMCFSPMGGGNSGGDELKQGMSRYAIALILATVTSYLSAGLTLFICFNTVLSVAQTSLQKK